MHKDFVNVSIGPVLEAILNLSDKVSLTPDGIPALFLEGTAKAISLQLVWFCKNP